MAIFNSYVKLPEGKYVEHCGVLIEDVVNHGKSLYSIYILYIHIRWKKQRIEHVSMDMW